MSTDEIIKEITKALGLIYQISGSGVRNDPQKLDLKSNDWRSFFNGKIQLCGGYFFLQLIALCNFCAKNHPK